MTDAALDREAIAVFEQIFELSSDERKIALDELAKDRPELRKRLDALLRAHERNELHTGGVAEIVEDVTPPERLGVYRIGDRIGRGGMGSVYRAMRDAGDFERAVAIKIVRPGPGSDLLIERFHRERQLLAGLIHPHIAQLYDGGETPEGAPYFVMELVDGMPLGLWLDQCAPDASSRVRVFADICAAVAFAHRNLVVHRDLTPSNVLVTPDGAVKLIDFGIARPPETDDGFREKSSLESLSLTPGFAAPERVHSSAVTTASDVFSLGRLAEQIFADQQDDPDFAAIITKATMVDPADRYATVDALAADMAAWRGHLPVEARAGGQSYVLRKFVQRHRVGVFVAAAVAALLIAALTVSLVALERERSARALAKQRTEQTRSIAKIMLFDAFDEVSRMPGSTKAREALASAALTYVSQLANQEGATVNNRLEAAQGFARLAEVMGSGSVATLGRVQDSAPLLAKAETLFDSVLAERPRDPEVQRSYAGMLVELARAQLFNFNDTAKAGKAARRALELVDAQQSANVDAARIAAAARSAIGETYSWDLNWPLAEAQYRQVESGIARMPTQWQNQPAVRRTRAANLRLLGESLHKQEKANEARAVLDRAVDMQERLLAQDPRNPVQMRVTAAANRYRAIVHRTNERDTLARSSMERGVAIAAKMRNADPNDASALHLWLLMIEPLAQMHMDVGDRARTFALHQRMLSEYPRLIELSGNAPGMRRSFSSALRVIGGNDYNLGAFTEACSAWQMAREQLNWLSAHSDFTGSDKSRQKDIDDYIASSCTGGARQGMGQKI